MEAEDGSYLTKSEKRELLLADLGKVLLYLLEAIEKKKTDNEIHYYAAFVAELLARYASFKRFKL